MPSVAQAVTWGMMILLIGFLVVILWKLFTGSISLEYLLWGDGRDPSDPSGYSSFPSPGRAQLLMITVVSASYFLFQVIQDPTHFPDVPDSLVAVLGGSQAVYLSGKAQGLLLGRLRDLIDRRMP